MKHIRSLFKPAGFAMPPIIIDAREGGPRRPLLPRVMRTIGALPVVYVENTISSATAGLYQ